MNENLKSKLMSVDRWIEVYKLDIEQPILELDINKAPLEELKKIVSPKEDDPDLFDGYELNAYQLELLNFYLDKKIVPDFDNFTYVLVAAGNYSW